MTATDLRQLVVAETPLVRIRHKHPSDALNDFYWRRESELSAFNAGQPFTVSFSDFVLQFERHLLFPDPAWRMYALAAPDGTHIGNIMYYNATATRDMAELGISIALESYRGAGIGAHATIAFLRYLWDTHPFRRIYLHTLESNGRARRCFARAGFQDVALVLRDGQPFVRMETRREWWLMWDLEGRFDYERLAPAPPAPAA